VKTVRSSHRPRPRLKRYPGLCATAVHLSRFPAIRLKTRVNATYSYHVTAAKRTRRSIRPSDATEKDAAREYVERAAELLKAIEISEGATQGSTALTPDQKRQVLEGLRQMRTLVSDPDPAFRNTRSLANLEQAVVQPWNAHKGPDADEFWARLADAGLSYQRGKTLREPRSR
jgi:hypothetical protein